LKAEKCLGARLPGHKGPFFSAIIDKLSERYENTPTYAEWVLNSIGSTIEGFCGLPYYRTKPRMTSDGYTWYWFLEYARGEGSVVILFPWTGYDGGIRRTTRAIAVYTKGEVSSSAIDEVVSEFMDAYINRRLSRVQSVTT
jgi:hypothetical protein